MRLHQAAMAAGLALGLMSGTAQASYIFKFSQIGEDVVLSGSGEINTDLLDHGFTHNVYPSAIDPDLAFAEVGPFTRADFYNGVSGPPSFGTGGLKSADYSSGDFAYLAGRYGTVAVSSTYISGSGMSGSGTYLNATLDSLGLIRGTYTYTYDEQTPDQGDLALRTLFVAQAISDTIVVQVGTVPLPASAPMLSAALLALGAVGYSLKRKKAAATA